LTQNTLILKLFCFSLILFLGGCASVLKEERKFSKNGLTIAFRSLRFLDDIEKIKFIYPIIISKENIRNHLLSLYHQDIVSPRRPRPVFSKRTVNELAPLFRTVMKKVEPGKYLNFEYQAANGITEGQVFATRKKIHWRILKINGVAHSNDPLRLKRPTWKLVRMPMQRYQILQTGGFKKIIKNRIIANIKMPFPRQRLQPQRKKNYLQDIDR
jgi:hypothetical protein